MAISYSSWIAHNVPCNLNRLAFWIHFPKRSLLFGSGLLGPVDRVFPRSVRVSGLETCVRLLTLEGITSGLEGTLKGVETGFRLPKHFIVGILVKYQTLSPYIYSQGSSP